MPTEVSNPPLEDSELVIIDCLVTLAMQEIWQTSARQPRGTITVKTKSCNPSNAPTREARTRKKTPCSRSTVPLAKTASCEAICLKCLASDFLAVVLCEPPKFNGL